jgi:hypothetical protein
MADSMFCEHGAPIGGSCRACEIDTPEMTEVERRMFDQDMELFFDILIDKMGEGKISPARAESFFPEEVRNRNK